MFNLFKNSFSNLTLVNLDQVQQNQYLEKSNFEYSSNLLPIKSSLVKLINVTLGGLDCKYPITLNQITDFNSSTLFLSTHHSDLVDEYENFDPYLHNIRFENSSFNKICIDLTYSSLEKNTKIVNAESIVKYLEFVKKHSKYRVTGLKLGSQNIEFITSLILEFRRLNQYPDFIWVDDNFYSINDMTYKVIMLLSKNGIRRNVKLIVTTSEHLQSFCIGADICHDGNLLAQSKLIDQLAEIGLTTTSRLNKNNAYIYTMNGSTSFVKLYPDVI